MKTFTGNLDGRREGLVIARNQRDAAQAAGTGLADFRRYWNSGPDVRDETSYGSWYVNMLYTRPYGSKESWVLGRCEVKRRSPLTLSPPEGNGRGKA